MSNEYSPEQVEKIASMLITYSKFKVSEIKKEGLPGIAKEGYKIATPKIIREKVKELSENSKKLESIVVSEENLERVEEEMISK